jgi:hypothetical protein
MKWGNVRTMSKRKRVQKAHPIVKPGRSFLVFLGQLLPDFCSNWRLDWAFHILEGTVFKLSYLSFAYLHRFPQFISFCLYLDREVERKITTGLYLGEGSENICFRIFDPLFQPTCLGSRSQVRKGLFSDPSPIRIASKPENRVAGSHHWCVGTLVLITYRWLESDPWLDLQGLHMDGQSWGKLVWSCTEVMVIRPYSSRVFQQNFQSSKQWNIKYCSTMTASINTCLLNNYLIWRFHVENINIPLYSYWFSISIHNNLFIENLNHK